MEGGKARSIRATAVAKRMASRGFLLVLKREITSLPIRHHTASKPQEVLRRLGRRRMIRELQAAKSGCHLLQSPPQAQVANRALSSSRGIKLQSLMLLHALVATRFRAVTELSEKRGVWSQTCFARAVPHSKRLTSV